MIRTISLILIISFCSLTVAENPFSSETEANDFYQGFRQLALSDNREMVSELFAYPFSDEVQTKEDLLRQYEAIFTDHLLSLIRCTEKVEKVGWRGYMLPPGAVWIDSMYYGEISPSKNSSTYVEDVMAQAADTENWYMRVQGINQDIGTCSNGS